MIKIKKIFIIITTFLILEKNVNAEIKDFLYMTVGNEPVTQSDVINEIKIILVLTKQGYSESKRDKLQEQAVKSIVERSIKEIEIKKYNFLQYDQDELNKRLMILSQELGVDLETLKNICESNELDFSLIENHLKIELYWNSLIYLLYKDRILINEDDINNELKLSLNKKDSYEYLISEIVTPLVSEDMLEEEIKNLKDKIKNEGFENVAKNLSISKSSLNGGNLGWLSEKTISEKLKSVIFNTSLGEVAEPIIMSDGIVFFKIIDKRKIKPKKNLEEIKKDLIYSKKLEILNMYSVSHYNNLKKTISIKFFE